MNLEWWHWIILAIVLILAELAIPAFFVFWFGLAALLVALMLLVFPDAPLVLQILLWSGASLAALALWLKVFRPKQGDMQVGTADGDVLGEVGLLVGAVAPYQRGRVRFQRPLMGSEEWACMAEQDITAGERVKVVAIEGNYLRVAKQ